MSYSSPQVPSGATARPQTAGPAGAPHRRRKRSLLLSAPLIGVLFGLLTLAGGTAAVVGQQDVYQATATLLVLPVQQKSTDTVASLYDSLSQGQVVESFQAVMSSPGFIRGILAAAGATPTQPTASGPTAARTTVASKQADVSVKTQVVPSTSLIDVTTSAPTPAVAEQVSDGVAARAVKDLSVTFNPYRITLVSAASGTAKLGGTGRTTLLGIVGLLAVIVTVAVQQAVHLFRRSRTPSPAPRGLTALK